jgi:hypothetical protein
MFRFLLPVLVVALLALPRLADACSCVPMSSCQRYAFVSSVFVADVLDVAEPVTPGPKTTRMRVVRAYKGGSAVGETVTVTMPRGSSASCSLDVAPGKRYVIFAAGEKGVYSTGLCHGSYSLQLDAPMPDLPPAAGRVTGQIQRYHVGAPTGQELTPVAGALVWIVTPDGRIEARTDAEGRFTMTGVPLGPRMVRSEVGPGEGVEHRIDLQFEGDCAEVYAYTAPTGRLIGAVLDHTGKPVVGANVTLRPASEPDALYRGGETGRSGSFDITELKPGSYYVSVGAIGGAPTTRYPYVTVFHPGVVDRQAAQSVTIGTDTVRLPAIRLQPSVALIPIVAEIVCRDGTVPASAFLSAERLPIAAERYGHKDFGSMESPQGRFTIRVVAGHRYLVRGEITVKEPMRDGGYGTYQLATPPMEVDPAAPPPRLVLRSELEKCTEAEGVTVPARR